MITVRRGDINAFGTNLTYVVEIKDLPEHYFRSTLDLLHRRYYLICSISDDLDVPFSLRMLFAEYGCFANGAFAGIRSDSANLDFHLI